MTFHSKESQLNLLFVKLLFKCMLTFHNLTLMKILANKYLPGT